MVGESDAVKRRMPLPEKPALKEYLALLEELGVPRPKEVEKFARTRAWKIANKFDLHVRQKLHSSKGSNVN
jgi:hypothetical protein